MKAWVIFDTTYGNTERVARAIAEHLAGEVSVSRVTEAKAAEAGTVDLLIVGSPTMAGRPTEAVQRFLRAIRPASLQKVRVAAFDTRVALKFARIFGYAADRIAASLRGKGGSEAAPPQGFIVRGKQGPLAEGELHWAKPLAQRG